MTAPFHRECAGIMATLETEVLPHLHDEFARGQAFSAIYVLSEMALRLGASLDGMLAVIERQDLLFTRVAAIADAAGLQLPLHQDRPGTPPRSQAAALLVQDAGERQVCELLDWCWTAGISHPAVHEIHILLRDEMRHRIEEERKLTPRPMFTQITGG